MATVFRWPRYSWSAVLQEVSFAVRQFSSLQKWNEVLFCVENIFIDIFSFTNVHQNLIREVTARYRSRFAEVYPVK